VPTPDQDQKEDEQLDTSWPEDAPNGEGSAGSAGREADGNGPSTDGPREPDADPTQPVYDEATKNGWFVISMKNDWKRIFAFDQ